MGSRIWPVTALLAGVAAICFSVLWLDDRHPATPNVMVIELSDIPVWAQSRLTMPMFIDVRNSDGKLVSAPILHNSLEPSVIDVAPGSYHVTAENCRGRARITATYSVTVVAVLFSTKPSRATSFCLVRQFE
jgi:hypothetical protein